MNKYILSILCLIVFVGCNEKEENENSTLNSFISLTAENDTLYTGQSTKITAVIDGSYVSFGWTATAGDILGSGSQVNYVAPTCTPGNNVVTCTAKATNKSESKTIVITVL